MKLYYSPGACSLSAHSLLREAGLAFEAVTASTKTHQLDDGTDYYTINPLGYVPMLELDDGTRLREVPVVLQYIADMVPTKNLAPAAGTLPRYRLQEWLTFIGTEIHKSYGALFTPSMPEEAKQLSRDKLHKRFTWVNEQLEGRDFVMGEHLSAADFYLFAVVRWTTMMNIDLTPFQNLWAHQARMAARTSVQEAMRVEGLLK